MFILWLIINKSAAKFIFPVFLFDSSWRWWMIAFFWFHIHIWYCSQQVHKLLTSVSCLLETEKCKYKHVMNDFCHSFNALFQLTTYSYLVDPASSHMLVSKIKPCMSKYILLHGETANGSLNQLWFLRSFLLHG